MEALRRSLWDVQRRGEERFSFTVGKPLAASLSGPQLRDLLDLLLPAAQRRSVQLRRERSGDWQVTVRLVYRLGVRLASCYSRYGAAAPYENDAFDDDEWSAFQRALRIVETARQDNPDPRTLARRLFDAIRETAVYTDLPAGARGHDLVISAAAVLVRHGANCQGFSDAYYLLGTLAGLRVGYTAGTKARRPHLWNTILLDGRWQTVDVTSGAFLPDEAVLAALGLGRGCL